jgi:hypothetical protein
MSGLPRSYRSIEEFEREEIRPGLRIGFHLDDLEEGSYEVELNAEAEREADPFERQSRERSSSVLASERDALSRRRSRRRGAH